MRLQVLQRWSNHCKPVSSSIHKILAARLVNNIASDGFVSGTNNSCLLPVLDVHKLLCGSVAADHVQRFPLDCFPIASYNVTRSKAISGCSNLHSQYRGISASGPSNSSVQMYALATGPVALRNGVYHFLCPHEKCVDAWQGHSSIQV
jgi:hypothetical protein